MVEIKHPSSVLAVAWSPDGKQLASAGEDGIVFLTAYPSGQALSKFETKGAVGGLAFSPDGKWLGVKSVDGPLTLREAANGRQLKQLHFPGYTANLLAFSPDGSTLVAGGIGEQMVWSHAKGGGHGSRQGQRPADNYAAVGPQAQLTAWGTPQGAIRLYYVDQRRWNNLQIQPARAMAFTQDALTLAAAHEDKTVRLWDVGTGRELRKFEGLREPARLLSLSTNGKVLAAFSPGDPVARIWDFASGRLRRRLTTPATQAVTLVLSPDGRALAVAGGDKLRVWNVATRELGDLGPPTKLPDNEMRRLWSKLADTDYTTSDAAFRKLATAGNFALPFMKSQVRAVAVPPVDWQRVESLLEDLDSDNFAARQKATTELAKYGELVQVPLQKLIAKNPSLEATRRAGKLLEKLKDPELTPDRLRSLEVIEILEALRTPEAHSALEEIARDALIAQIRLAALEALDRARREEKMP